MAGDISASFIIDDLREAEQDRSRFSYIINKVSNNCDVFAHGFGAFLVVE